MSGVIIIAEIGENHIGDMQIAKMLIEKVAEAGADYVKFQSYKPEDFRQDDPEYEWFEQVSLSDETHFILKEHAEKCGVRFLSSPFSMERAKFLCEDLGLKKIKIASGVMLKLSMLDYLNTHADTVFLSTGMATMEEIKQALECLKKVPNIFILHCITQYPCKDEDANLNAILALKKTFPGYRIGYSDHVIGTEACLAAAALGAEVIEKHITFDKNEKTGTDHILSATPDELKEMINGVRKIDCMLGTGIKEPSRAEQKNLFFVRNRFSG